jgi:hypothetical protein
VRENLREVLGRSPDPDEVYAEAHRPKGSTVTKSKKTTVTSTWEDIAGEEGSEGDGRNESVSIPSHTILHDTWHRLYVTVHKYYPG